MMLCRVHKVYLACFRKCGPCNWKSPKRLSLFLLHFPLSHSQENSAAADVGRRFVWLEDIQPLTGETFRTDKKPDPANWEYKSLYRGDIARYRPIMMSFLILTGRKELLSPALSAVSVHRPSPEILWGFYPLLSCLGLCLISHSKMKSLNLEIRIQVGLILFIHSVLGTVPGVIGLQ